MNTERRPRRKCFGPLVAAVAAVAWFALPAAPGGQENLGRGRVSGKIIDERKQPVEGAQIIAQCLTAMRTKLDARTDAKGGFIIGGLGTGPWRFTARKSGYQDAALDVDVHQLRANPPLVIVLKDAAVAAAADGSREAAENALTKGISFWRRRNTRKRGSFWSSSWTIIPKPTRSACRSACAGSSWASWTGPKSS